MLLKVFGGRTASQLGELGGVLVFTGRRVGVFLPISLDDAIVGGRRGQETRVTKVTPLRSLSWKTRINQYVNEKAAGSVDELSVTHQSARRGVNPQREI